MKILYPKAKPATRTINEKPKILVTILVKTKPAIYSLTVRGEAKKLTKLRDQISSKNAVMIP